MKNDNMQKSYPGTQSRRSYKDTPTYYYQQRLAHFILKQCNKTGSFYDASHSVKVRVLKSLKNRPKHIALNISTLKINPKYLVGKA